MISRIFSEVCFSINDALHRDLCKIGRVCLVLVFLLFETTGFSQGESLVVDGATLKLVADTCEFTEGPAADKAGNVFFTDQPNNRILKWNAADNEVSVYLEPAGRSNGLYFDKNGNLLSCADEKFELWKIDSNKNVTVLLDNYQGKKLNGPNDLWIDKHGGIYFTDPYYQRPWWKRSKGELNKMNVYYLSPDQSKLTIVDCDFVKPNGIIGSIDENILYVADRGANKTYAFDLKADGTLENKRLFVKRDSDGMTMDEMGNVYLTGTSGVDVFNRNGEHILTIPIDQKWTANVTFGGKDNRTLFITAMNSAYTLEMNVSGGY